MNEQELKELWQQAETENFPVINFEHIQKNMNSWQGKLRRKIELDFLLGVLILVIYLGLMIPFPHGLYLLPFIFIIYLWYYRRLWIVYRSETQAQDIVSTKEYFEDKISKLSGFIRQCRIFALIFLLPFVLVSYYVSLSRNPKTTNYMKYEYLSAHPDLIYNSLIFCAILTIGAIIGVEILLRIFYLPSLDRVKELIKQLESE